LHKHNEIVDVSTAFAKLHTPLGTSSTCIFLHNWLQNTSEKGKRQKEGFRGR